MLFRQPTHPQIDRVDIAIGLLQRLLHGHVGGDFGKARHPLQAVGCPHRVVIGQAVVAAPLDVQRCQIKAPLAGGPKEEVPHIVHHLGVDLLGPIAGEIFEQGFDSHFGHGGGVEEAVLEPQFIAHGDPIIVEKLDVLAEHAVAEAKRRGGELRCQAGIHIRPIARPGSDAGGPGAR